MDSEHLAPSLRLTRSRRQAGASGLQRVLRPEADGVGLQGKGGACPVCAAAVRMTTAMQERRGHSHYVAEASVKWPMLCALPFTHQQTQRNSSSASSAHILAGRSTNSGGAAGRYAGSDACSDRWQRSCMNNTTARESRQPSAKRRHSESLPPVPPYHQRQACDLANRSIGAALTTAEWHAAAAAAQPGGTQRGTAAQSLHGHCIERMQCGGAICSSSSQRRALPSWALAAPAQHGQPSRLQRHQGLHERGALNA